MSKKKAVKKRKPLSTVERLQRQVDRYNAEVVDEVGQHAVTRAQLREQQRNAVELMRALGFDDPLEATTAQAIERIRELMNKAKFTTVPMNPEKGASVEVFEALQKIVDREGSGARPTNLVEGACFDRCVQLGWATAFNGVYSPTCVGRAIDLQLSAREVHDELRTVRLEPGLPYDLNGDKWTKFIVQALAPNAEVRHTWVFPLKVTDLRDFAMNVLSANHDSFMDYLYDVISQGLRKVENGQEENG